MDTVFLLPSSRKMVAMKDEKGLGLLAASVVILLALADPVGNVIDLKRFISQPLAIMLYVIFFIAAAFLTWRQFRGGPRSRPGRKRRFLKKKPPPPSWFDFPGPPVDRRRIDPATGAVVPAPSPEEHRTPVPVADTLGAFSVALGMVLLASLLIAVIVLTVLSKLNGGAPLIPGVV